METIDFIHPLAKASSERSLTTTEALGILHARGANLSWILSGAHQIKEKYLGRSIGKCSIINAKSGHCAENCAFCAQSVHHSTQSPVYPLRSTEVIVTGAKQAAAAGCSCYGIVTSGTRIESSSEFEQLLEAIRTIRKTTRMDPSVSLGILSESMARALAEAGCVTYHHNLETARSFFPNICTTHDYAEDIKTIRIAKRAGLKVCCGGIIGLGESLEQRVELAATLRELDVDAVPLNFLTPVAGTPLENTPPLAPMDAVRCIALFRYMLPDKHIKICGGRQANLRELQAWMFLAGASGVMIGNYLTTSGRDLQTDLQLFKDLELEFDVE